MTSIPDDIRASCDIIRLDKASKATFTALNPEFLPVLQHLKEAEFTLYFLCGWEMVEYVKPRQFSAERVAGLLSLVKASQGAFRVCVKRDQMARFEKIIRHFLNVRVKKAVEAEPRIAETVAKRYADAVVASQYVVRGCLDQEASLRVVNLASALAADATPAKKTVASLLRLMEADPALYDHNALTASFAAVIVRQLAWGKRDAKLCIQAAFLHDMERLCAQTHKGVTAGKVAEGAMEEVRLAIAGGLPFNDSAVDVIHHHRERFQGQGYPDHLAGRLEEDNRNGIGKYARVVGLACAVAELSIQRPKGEPLGLRRVLAIVNKAGESLFDPQMTQALVAEFLVKKDEDAA